MLLCMDVLLPTDCCNRIDRSLMGAILGLLGGICLLGRDREAVVGLGCVCKGIRVLV